MNVYDYLRFLRRVETRDVQLSVGCAVSEYVTEGCYGGWQEF